MHEHMDVDLSIHLRLTLPRCVGAVFVVHLVFNSFKFRKYKTHRQRAL